FPHSVRTFALSGDVLALPSRLPKVPKALARSHLGLARTVTRRTQHYYTGQRGEFLYGRTSKNDLPFFALRNRDPNFAIVLPFSHFGFYLPIPTLFFLLSP